MASADPKSDLDPKCSFVFDFPSAVIDHLVRGEGSLQFRGIENLLGVSIKKHSGEWAYLVTAPDRETEKLAHGFLKELRDTASYLVLKDAAQPKERQSISLGQKHIHKCHRDQITATFGQLLTIYGKQLGLMTKIEREIDRRIQAYFNTLGIVGGPETLQSIAARSFPGSPSHKSGPSPVAAPQYASPRKKRGLKNLADFAPRNDSQALLYLSIKDPEIDIVFGTGPAGGGKTFGALQAAFEAIGNDDIDRIILFRPKRTTSGEETAAVPGDSDKKAWPYVKSFDSACRAVTGASLSALHKKAEGKIIFGIPEAERGETYHRSLVVIDEAQNLTVSEAKMLITRIGEGSKLVFLGDIGQTDLRNEESGLVFLINHLGPHYFDDRALQTGVSFVEFTSDDSSARHPLLPSILKAFERTPEGVSPTTALSPKKAQTAFLQAIEGNREKAIEWLGKLHMATAHRFEQALEALRARQPESDAHSKVVHLEGHRPRTEA